MTNHRDPIIEPGVNEYVETKLGNELVALVHLNAVGSVMRQLTMPVHDIGDYLCLVEIHEGYTRVRVSKDCLEIVH